MLLNIAIIIAAFVGMEFVAWFTHKYIMHGALWFLHRDHHKSDDRGLFQRNDFFFLIFALPAIICLAIGTANNFSLLFWIGFGITLYGFAYFIVHDVFIHQRIKFFRTIDLGYFKGVRRAHKVHHKHLEKEDGECFGMLWVPMRFFKEAKS